jgi:hypothetical protein
MAHFNIGDSQKLSENQALEDKGLSDRSSYHGRGRRRHVSTGTAKSMGSQVLGLSLFIMLLAFFIVLNAISSFDEVKVDPVMESLGYAFASKMSEPKIDDHPSVRADEDQSIYEGDTIERIRALFNSQIPSSDIVMSHKKGEMYVRVAYDDLRSAVMAVGQRNALDGATEKQGFLGGFFLPTLLSLMKADEMGIAYRMDMILTVKENPAELKNQRPQTLRAYVKKIAEVASRIEGSGLSTKLLSAGVDQGEEGFVELYFRPHVPYNPLGDEINE